jgi:carbon monoxide dehydrogenase subunit G
VELTHEFEVPAGVDRAWEVLNDIETIAPCMPGATLEAVDGDDFRGTVKVKVGPIQLTYAGTARFVERDADARRARIEANGTDRRGGGTAAAVITASLTEASTTATAVTVHTDLTVTGRPAQFGRGVMVDVGNKLLGQFADCLAEQIVAPTAEEEVGEAAAPTPGTSAEPLAADRPSEAVTPPGRPEAEAVDLLDLAGGSVLKRLAPLAVVVAAVAWLLRRLRR